MWRDNKRAQIGRTDIIMLYDGAFNQQEGIHIVVGIHCVALVNRATNFKVMSTAASIAE